MKRPFNEPGDRFDRCLEDNSPISIGSQIDGMMTKIEDILCCLHHYDRT